MSENAAAAGQKSKSQLRAERRAVQEAQRASKATSKEGQGQQAPKQSQPSSQQQQQKNRTESISSINQQKDQQQQQQQQSTKSARKKTPSIGDQQQQRSRSREQSHPVGADQSIQQHEVEKIAPSGRRGSKDENVEKPSFKSSMDVHSAFVRLGSRLSSNQLSGSDAQCLATIDAFRQLAIDYHPPGDKAYSRELENAIKPCISRIAGNRSLPPAMASLVKQLKLFLSTITNETPEKEARQLVVDWLEDFAERNIILSTRAIAEAVTEKLKALARSRDGQSVVVMIYTFSATVEKTLMEAHKQGVPFEVVIVDSMPKKEGLISVRRLSSLGVKCQYVLLTGMMTVLSRVNVVLLGAEGLLANGNVVAPLGSTQVAMTSKSRNVPVLVLCHTYKFNEKVFTVTLLETDWPDTEVMPAEFVTGVVTELRTLPCSAVPAVLRVKQLGGGIS